MYLPWPSYAHGLYFTEIATYIHSSEAGCILMYALVILLPIYRIARILADFSQVRQNKSPAKITGYTVFYMDVGNFNSELQVQPPHSRRYSVALWWHTCALDRACMGFETLLPSWREAAECHIYRWSPPLTLIHGGATSKRLADAQIDVA